MESVSIGLWMPCETAHVNAADEILMFSRALAGLMTMPAFSPVCHSQAMFFWGQGPK